MQYQLLSIIFAIVLLFSARFGTGFVTSRTTGTQITPEPVAAIFQPLENELEETGQTLLTAPPLIPEAFPIQSSPPFSPSPKLIFLPQIGAKSALLYDVTDQKMLVEKKADQAVPIASITKFMTALVAKELFQTGATFAVSSSDLALPGPHHQLIEGDSLTLEEAAYFLLVGSNNAVARAIERSAGENKEFVALMNQRAKSLSMVSTVFGDAAGLVDDTSWSTARDLMKFALFLLEKHPDLLQISRNAKMTVITQQGKYFSLTNTNELLNEIPQIIGGKTGFTERAGGCLLLIFEANGHKFVSVVLGSPDRFGDTKRLIQFARESL